MAEAQLLYGTCVSSYANTFGNGSIRRLCGGFFFWQIFQPCLPKCRVQCICTIIIEKFDILLEVTVGNINYGGVFN